MCQYVSYCNTTRTCIDTHVGTKSVSGTATGHGTRCANTHMHLTKRAHRFRMRCAYINDAHLSGARQCAHSYTGCDALVSMIKQHTQLKYGYQLICIFRVDPRISSNPRKIFIFCHNRIRGTLRSLNLKAEICQNAE